MTVLLEEDEGRQPIWSALETRIGYHFDDQKLLLRAMTHRSFANESRHQALDNERLEFLGDAVLDLVVSCRLLEAHPDVDEGELTRLRSELVNEQFLAGLARSIKLGECLLLGRGELRSGGQDKDSLLADSLEALLGAVFLDGGYAKVAQMIGRLYSSGSCVPVSSVGHDFKTRLQEIVQGRHQGRPDYRLTGTSGPDHLRRYEVDVLVEGVVCGSGRGSTKKRAEQDAARLALAALGQLDNE